MYADDDDEVSLPRFRNIVHTQVSLFRNIVHTHSNKEGKRAVEILRMVNVSHV